MQIKITLIENVILILIAVGGRKIASMARDWTSDLSLQSGAFDLSAIATPQSSAYI